MHECTPHERQTKLHSVRSQPKMLYSFRAPTVRATNFGAFAPDISENVPECTQNQGDTRKIQNPSYSRTKGPFINSVTRDTGGEGCVCTDV